MKCRFGEDDAQIQAAERAAQPSMLELVEEIRNSIQYFASLPGRLPVSRVLVTGGGSALHGLLPMLEAQVRIPVHSGSPLDRLDTSKLDLDRARRTRSARCWPRRSAWPCRSPTRRSRSSTCCRPRWPSGPG